MDESNLEKTNNSEIDFHGFVGMVLLEGGERFCIDSIDDTDVHSVVIKASDTKGQEKEFNIQRVAVYKLDNQDNSFVARANGGIVHIEPKS